LLISVNDDPESMSKRIGIPATFPEMIRRLDLGKLSVQIWGIVLTGCFMGERRHPVFATLRIRFLNENLTLMAENYLHYCRDNLWRNVQEFRNCDIR